MQQRNKLYTSLYESIRDAITRVYACTRTHAKLRLNGIDKNTGILKQSLIFGYLQLPRYTKREILRRNYLVKQ